MYQIWIFEVFLSQSLFEFWISCYNLTPPPLSRAIEFEGFQLTSFVSRCDPYHSGGSLKYGVKNEAYKISPLFNDKRVRKKNLTWSSTLYVVKLSSHPWSESNFPGHKKVYSEVKKKSGLYYLWIDESCSYLENWALHFNSLARPIFGSQLLVYLLQSLTYFKYRFFHANFPQPEGFRLNKVDESFFTNFGL